MRDIWGDFNGRMANTFLVNLNELSKKDTLECQGKIKGLITDGKLTINSKGMNQYDIQSYHRFIITTNNEDPIVSKSDDRRNLIIKSSNELKGNVEYFKKFYEMMEDVNVIKSFYEHLKNIPDLDNFNKLPIPQTEYQNEIKDMNMDIEERWLRDIVMKNKSDFEMSGVESFKSFLDFCNSNGIEYRTNAVKLGIKIKRLIGDCVNKKHTEKGAVTTFQIEKIREKLGMGCLIK
jgi:phage/plasmid-associated DNA primase